MQPLNWQSVRTARTPEWICDLLAPATAHARAACADDGSIFDGDVPQAMMDAQMQALNSALAPTAFQLRIAGVDYTSNVSVSVAGKSGPHVCV